MADHDSGDGGKDQGPGAGTPDKVMAGKMPPWDIDQLPVAPPDRFELRRILGPGLLMVGMAIGGGEWLTGPAMTAQFGGTLMWIATLSILLQCAYNLEVMRYTLYCGEPILVGFFRLAPGPRFWTVVYLIVDFGAIWPYLAANAAVPLLAAFIGHLPGKLPTTYLTVTQVVAETDLPISVVNEMAEHEERFGAVFIGSRDGPRERLFAEVLGRGEDLEIYGGGWRAGNNRAVPAQDSHSSVGALTKIKRQIEFVNKEGIPAWVRKMGPKPASVDDAVFAQVARGSLAPDKYAATIQGARTLIGVNRYESYRYPVARPDSYSRLRDIEAPMMGACYLTEWCPDLDHMYEPGRHLEVYRTSDEMIGKLGELNADVEKRRRLRQEGQKWALAKHSVGKSLQRIGDALSGGTSVA